MTEEVGTAAQVEDFILASVGGKFLRFNTIEAVPEGSDVITLARLTDMPIEKIGELYGAVAGVNSKNFKNRVVAVDSFTYQVKKLPIHDPDAPVAAVQPTAAAGKVGKVGGARATPAERASKKAGETFELLSPPDVDKAMGGLAPQAKELIAVMVELSKEGGSVKLPRRILEDRLRTPDVVSRMRTRQDPTRIMQYYQKKLVDRGLLRVS